MTPFLIALIFITVLLGETFGVLFGGGSFFIQPALMAFGFDAKVSVANDVAAASFGAFAYIYYKRRRLIDQRIELNI